MHEYQYSFVSHQNTIIMKLDLKVIYTLRVLYGLPLIIFGLNKFLGFVEVAPPADLTAQMFLGAMFSSYLAPTVGLLEIVGGLLLVVPRTAFVGWLVLLPVITNIFLFHLAHDLPGNGIWLFPTLMAILSGITFNDKLNTLIK